MKHTPASWKADTVVDSTDLHMEIYIPNRTLAYVLHYPNDSTIEETEANATLIAAAPELLEALEEILNFVNTRVVTYNDKRVADIARHAIQKAKGEITP